MPLVAMYVLLSYVCLAASKPLRRFRRQDITPRVKSGPRGATTPALTFSTPMS